MDRFEVVIPFLHPDPQRGTCRAGDVLALSPRQARYLRRTGKIKLAPALVPAPVPAPKETPPAPEPGGEAPRTRKRS